MLECCNGLLIVDRQHYDSDGETAEDEYAESLENPHRQKCPISTQTKAVTAIAIIR